MLKEWQLWQGLKPTTLHTIVMVIDKRELAFSYQTSYGQRMNAYTNLIMGI